MRVSKHVVWHMRDNRIRDRRGFRGSQRNEPMNEVMSILVLSCVDGIMGDNFGPWQDFLVGFVSRQIHCLG